MKNVTTICLVVGLVIACTDNKPVEMERSAVKQDTPDVLYNGKLYEADDETLASFMTSASITLRFDFEEYVRLFDNEAAMNDFVSKNYQGKYAASIGNLLKIDAEGLQSPELKASLGSMARPERNENDGASRVQNTIYDFELAILNAFCSYYPVQAWYVNLVSYPSGEISSILGTVGYMARGFSYDVPPGGSIYMLMRGPRYGMYSCEHTIFVATVPGCYNPSFPTCNSITNPSGLALDPVNYLFWSVTIGS
jgi:hypothetical protein